MANNVIELNPALLQSNRKTLDGIISPSDVPQRELVANHVAEPIKDTKDIERVCQYFLDREEWRNYMLFVVGINMGLRVSDLVTLRFGDLIDENLRFREGFEILEKKTAETRKRKKNRYVTINDAVEEAVTLYLEHTPGITLGHYMFRSESNRGKNDNNPVYRRAVELVLKRAASDLDLPYKVSTHTLRKTFAYQFLAQNGNEPRALLLLQKILGHSSTDVTLAYIGATREEIQEAYKNLNLGAGSSKFVSQVGIYEKEEIA